MGYSLQEQISIAKASGLTDEDASAYAKSHTSLSDDAYDQLIDAGKITNDQANVLRVQEIRDGAKLEDAKRTGNFAQVESAIAAAAEAKLKTQFSIEQLVRIKNYGYNTADGVHHQMSVVGQQALQAALTGKAQSDSSISDIMKNVIKLGTTDEISPNSIPTEVAKYLKEKYGDDSNINFSTVQDGVSKAIQATGVPAQVAAQIVQGNAAALPPGSIGAMKSLYEKYKINSDKDHTLLALSDNDEFLNDYQKLPSTLREMTEKAIGGQAAAKLAKVKLSSDTIQAQIGSLPLDQLPQLKPLLKKFNVGADDGQVSLNEAYDNPQFKKELALIGAPWSDLVTKTVRSIAETDSAKATATVNSATVQNQIDQRAGEGARGRLIAGVLKNIGVNGDGSVDKSGVSDFTAKKFNGGRLFGPNN